MIYNGSQFGHYATKTFLDVYDNETDFLQDYKNLNSAFPNKIPTTIADAKASLLFYLLYAKYGNNPIANFDENQFKYKLFAIIFQYGPTWEKRLTIQADLRNLTLDDLRLGSKQVNQHAYNPSQDVNPNNNGTDTYGEINTTNEQNRTWYKKSKLDAYANLMALLEKDVTEEFVEKFRKLFRKSVEPDLSRFYIYNEEGF